MIDKMYFSYLFVSGCTIIAAVLCFIPQQSVIGDCNHYVEVMSHCLPESQWVYCNAADEENCNGRKSKISGAHQPLGKTHVTGSNTNTGDPVIKSEYCYTQRDCEWLANDSSLPSGCYPVDGSAVNVPDNIPIYTADTCGG
jgi:hypothetical protein